jgi:hypothetical protein
MVRKKASKSEFLSFLSLIVCNHMIFWTTLLYFRYEMYLLSLRSRGIATMQSTTSVVVCDYTVGVNESYENNFSPNRREVCFVANVETVL